MIEPFLLSDIELEHKEQGNVVRKSGPFVRITKKGRVATENAYSYIKLCHSLQKLGWFNNESLGVKSE